MNNSNKISIGTIRLLLITSFASFGAVLIAPALPLISHVFGISIGRASISLSIYLVGYGVGQLLYGPLANHFGRKSALITGIGIALAGSMAGVFATFQHDFSLFLIARFLTALGAASGLIISMILIKDIYDDVNSRSVFAKVVLAFAFVPFIANALGGTLSHYFGLQILNVVMIVYALGVLFIAMKLPETLAMENKIVFSAKNIMKTYRQFLINSQFIKFVFLFALAGASSYIYNGLAPIIAIQSMNISASMYGWLSILPSLGIFFGGWLSSRYASKATAVQMIIAGFSIILTGNITLIILFKLQQINLASLYISGFLTLTGMAILTPNASMHALLQVGDHANGATFMNGFSLLLCSMGVYVAGFFLKNSIFILPFSLLVIAFVGLLISILCRKHIFGREIGTQCNGSCQALTVPQNKPG